MDFVAPFNKLETVSDLETATAIARGSLPRVLCTPHEQLYYPHCIPKRNPARGHRVVWEILDETWARDVRTLNRHLSAFVRDWMGNPSPIHGYVRGRSILTNARPHLGADAVVRADISNFFRSINEKRVATALEAIDMSKEIARVLAQLSCIEGALALGIATAPTLANLVARGVDKGVAALLSGREVRYTRYGDDMTFSGPMDVLPSQEEIRDILKSEGFSLAEEKFRLKKRGQAFVVTGLTTFDESQPRVPKAVKRRLRLELHFIEKFGVAKHTESSRDGTAQACINRIDGQIQYVRGIERTLGDTLNQKWRRILRSQNHRVEWKTQRPQTRDATIFIDESVFSSGGQRVIALGAVVAYDADVIRREVRNFARKTNADTFRTGVGGPWLSHDVLHYCDLSQDVRLDVARLVAELPIRAFIAYDVLHDDCNYKRDWLRLYKQILQYRLMGLDNDVVDVVAEENERIAPQRLMEIASTVYEESVARDGKRPVSKPRVQAVAKTGDVGIALADAVLGLFKEYATAARDEKRTAEFKGGARPAAEMRFERIRNKVRLIHSATSNTNFGTDRNAFKPWPGGVPC